MRDRERALRHSHKYQENTMDCAERDSSMQENRCTANNGGYEYFESSEVQIDKQSESIPVYDLDSYSELKKNNAPGQNVEAIPFEPKSAISSLNESYITQDDHEDDDLENATFIKLQVRDDAHDFNSDCKCFTCIMEKQRRCGELIRNMGCLLYTSPSPRD